MRAVTAKAGRRAFTVREREELVGAGEGRAYTIRGKTAVLVCQVSLSVHSGWGVSPPPARACGANTPTVIHSLSWPICLVSRSLSPAHAELALAHAQHAVSPQTRGPGLKFMLDCTVRTESSWKSPLAPP